MNEHDLTLPEGLEARAHEALEASIMTFDGEPVGTVAARDDRPEPVNYHHCFVRDFAVSAVVFLQEGRHDIVRNFLRVLVDLQSRDASLDCFEPGRGLMPASFVVRREGGREVLVGDYGEKAIARVTPVDSGFWWLLLLRAYTRHTGDRSLVDDSEVRIAIRLILDLSLTAQMEMLPTLLVPDGAFMIDRRMGVYGHPLDVQVLFFGALRAAAELLESDDEYQEHADNRIRHLLHHLRDYYWVDIDRLSRMHRFPVEEYGSGVVNHYNVYPESIPNWLPAWIPDQGGYFTANVGPGRMDFRFLAQGNLLSLTNGLADDPQANRLLHLIEDRWESLIGRMPMKLCYPALEGREWEVVTGFDAKNLPWSYHNGGSWPCLLWLLGAACVYHDRADLAARAVSVAAARIGHDDWPEYYDTRQGRLVGREARQHQTWTAAGFLAALGFLRQPETVDMLVFEDGIEPASCSGVSDLSLRADARRDGLTTSRRE